MNEKEVLVCLIACVPLVEEKLFRQLLSVPGAVAGVEGGKIKSLELKVFPFQCRSSRDLLSRKLKQRPNLHPEVKSREENNCRPRKSGQSAQ
jgi:hypothetical protein